jgi:hypothetical protein
MGIQPIKLWGALTFCAIAACGAGSSRQSGQAENGPRGGDCVSELRAAAEVDTTKLQRREIDGPTGESAEGSTIVEFRDSIQRRLLVVTYFGETGRTRYAYYFTSPTSYLQRAVEERYAAPLTTTPPSVASSTRSEVLVCNGTLTGASADSTVYRDGRDALSEAVSLLRNSRKP